MPIHPRTEIHPSALIADDVEIGPGVVIGPSCVIKSGVEIGPNVILGLNTTICEEVRIYPGAIIGADPQDAKYDGSLTICEVGPRTIVREYCTISRGTTASGATIIGSDCMLMSLTHVGHDCRLGDHVVTATGAAFGGHCEIGDRTIVGGNTGVHQFVRIGRLAMIGGMSGVRQDAPPFMITAGHPPARVYGVNTVGLKRNGVSPASRAAIKQAFRLLYRSGLNTRDALAKIERELERTVEIGQLLEFYATSRRGVARGHKEAAMYDDDDLRNEIRRTTQLA